MKQMCALIRVSFWLAVVGFAGANSTAAEPEPAAPAAISKQTKECIGCHETVTPGIVADWKASRHASVTPAVALGRKPLEKRISATDLPEALKTVVVGCYECHGQESGNHKDSFKHFDFTIHVVVTPNDCKSCHPVEAEQYSRSKKSFALSNIQKNPLYHTLVNTVVGVTEVKEGRLAHLNASDPAKAASCYGCHGTEVGVAGMRKISTDLGDIEVPNLTNWPNQGVGRVNPDGSRGSCTSCHARHGFSLEVARKPHTCAQCHLEPDTPAWEVYKESKHGNLYESQGHGYNWQNVPWRVGTDFRAPTCASCHNSLIATPDGEQIVPRTHDFGSRMWVRLFGLPYSHPQPKSGDTTIIKNKDGLPLPTAFTGEPASEFLIDKAEQAKRLGVMKKVCQSCHGSSWTEKHFERLDHTIAETDRMTRSATDLVMQAWAKGLAENKNPFDEPIEMMWGRQWLFYGNSIRYGAAMIGPDYTSFKNGWWDMQENLAAMQEWLKKHSGEAK